MAIEISEEQLFEMADHSLPSRLTALAEETGRFTLEMHAGGIDYQFFYKRNANTQKWFREGYNRLDV